MQRLVRVALAVQNYLDDMANTLERLHATINWTDPKATLIFLFACLAIVLAIAAFSLPVVLSIGLCWTVSHPTGPSLQAVDDLPARCMEAKAIRVIVCKPAACFD